MISFEDYLKGLGIKGIHPAADMLPLATEEEFETLCKNIEANGLLDSLKVDEEGQLLDGRNRFTAWALRLENVPA
jgi:ParB-like chromosome segregation protein Spo0J